MKDTYTGTEYLTEEQRKKLQALYEAENPKPRNRAERRLQSKKQRRAKAWK